VNPVLYPTHQCFDDALDFIGTMLKNGDIKLDSPYWVVHALCRVPTGDVMAHGWVEHEADVISAYVVGGAHAYLEIPKDTFYEWYHPFDITRYTITEALRLNIKHGHYGPWETRYREACGSGRKILGSVTVPGLTIKEKKT
jgi:hypothetical protein